MTEIQVALLSSLALMFPASAQEPAETEAKLEWDARAAEHLFNRAGFGARPAEIRRWVEAGPEALVEHLLAPRGSEPFYVEDPEGDVERLREMRKVSGDERRRLRQLARQKDRRQYQAFLEWWVERLITADDPLRERMTLFWHGLLTSSFQTVKRSRWMIDQNQLFRDNATGSYATLLKAILKDPAMLRYLDNNTNKKGKPNENLAREVMELFSLGEGHYTESDVKEAARALTGHSFQPGGTYRFFARRHDYGPKDILGARGRHDASDLADILLAQEQCARYIAGRLIHYFEGVEPEAQRLERYAALLRDGGYELEPLLRTLFLDPDFYREDIIGARVASPIDFLVGSMRRLGTRIRPQFVVLGAAMLGERLGDPPNVKGWEGGEAWISTSTLMMRGNLVGMVLGEVETEDLDDRAELELLAVDVPDDPASDATDEAMMQGEPMMSDTEQMVPESPRSAEQRKNSELTRLLRGLDRAGYRPRVHFAFRIGKLRLRTDEEVVDYLLDELLAIEPPAETRAMLVAHFAREREDAGLGRKLPRGSGERLLRRVAHLILSLPEAQLH
ncbi:MAG: DUF1800 domain-containing protein [bacterium]|nr:DUF1800 domain-containing protein [bacterium]